MQKKWRMVKMTRELKVKRIEVLNEIARLINKCDCDSGANEKGEYSDCKNCEKLRKLGAELDHLVRNPISKKSKRVIKEGIRPKDWKMPVDEYFELKKRKLSDIDIAEMYSISRDTLKKFKKSQGISRGRTSQKKEVV